MSNTPQIGLTLEHIEQIFQPCQSWEERYRQLLLLSKQLQPIDPQYQTEQHKVIGCESDVWLHYHQGQLQIDSNARIIKGLLVILLACIAEYPLQTEPAKILFRKTLTQLGLAQHLSESRNNGITAIWQQINTNGC
ncbi:SufE family protein [Agarivorans sp. QJM3NY_29]|uniref:SufE family protein n=1 Tax=unclassified Agarivorans TaxID=2636026 RepID=UPI003D7CC279